MSHQDPTSLTPPNLHHQDLKVVFDWLLEHADFAAVGFRCTCSWTPRSLTVAALLWAWSAEATLTAAGFSVQELRGYATFASLGLLIAIYSAAAYQNRLRRWTAGSASAKSTW